MAEGNRSQSARLRALAARLDPAALAVRLPNGWTVAVALAHIAFWDRQRLCLMRRWAAGTACQNDIASVPLSLPPLANSVVAVNAIPCASYVRKKIEFASLPRFWGAGGLCLLSAVGLSPPPSA